MSRIQLSTLAASAFYDELEKIGKAAKKELSQKEKNREAIASLGATGAAYGTLLANSRWQLSHIPGEIIHQTGALRLTMRPSKHPVSPERLKTLMGITSNPAHIESSTHVMIPSKATATYPERIFTPKELGLKELPERVTIAGRTGAPAYAHELGHLKLRENVLGNLLFGKGRVYAQMAGIPASLAMAAAADPESKWSRYSPAVAGAAFAPMLADEALASILGLIATRKAGVPLKEIGRQALGHTLAGATYLGLPAFAMGSAELTRQVKKAIKKKMEDKKK